MPRIRTIKPDFWKHEELSELAPEAHMLAAALLNYADDEGYFRAHPKLVKAECCPLRDDSLSAQDALFQLHSIGYVRLFDGSDGKRYGHVVKFTQHQQVNRPSASKIKHLDPGPDASLPIQGGFSEDSRPEEEGEQGREGKGISVPNGTPTPPSGGQLVAVEGGFPPLDRLPRSQSGRATYPAQFEDFWAAYPKNPADTKADAYKAWRSATRKRGVTADDLLDGAQRYAGDCEARGHDRPAHVQTWINREGWTADYATGGLDFSKV